MTEPKIYPKRKEPEITVRTCICLHERFSHESTWYLTDGKCEKCQCPKYKELDCFTYDELRELKKANGVSLY